MALNTLLPKLMLLNREVSQFLSDDGTDSGGHTMNLNYTGAGVGTTMYGIVPPAGKVLYLERLVMSWRDGGGGTMQEFGNLGAALTNGFCPKRYRGTFGSGAGASVEFDYCNGQAIKDNGSSGVFCYDIDRKDWGAGDDLFVSRWTFTKDGYAVKLSDTLNDFLAVELSDDLSGLTDFTIRATGVWDDE